MLMMREEIIQELMPHVGSIVGVKITRGYSTQDLFRYKMESVDDLLREIVSRSREIYIDAEVEIYVPQTLEPVQLSISDIGRVGQWYCYNAEDMDCTQEKVDKINEILSTCFKLVEVDSDDCDRIVEFTLASVYITEDMLGKYSESKSITVGGN